jgi:maleylacetate reductase
VTVQRHDFRRVVFGEGSIDRLALDIGEAGYCSVFIVTTRGRAKLAEKITAPLGNSLAGVFSDAVEHTLVETTNRAEAEIKRAEADAIVAIGGGSAIGLGKALVLRTGLPLVAVPTTYSGSEMTSIYGETDATGKKTGKDARVAPKLIIYDPNLTLDLPADVSAASGVNALAHSIESLYAPNATTASDERAEQSIRLLASSLPRIVVNPSNSAARNDALQGAQLAGEALSATAMGLHHRICHVLGGSFRMPHAKTHAVILRYVVAYNFDSSRQAMTRIARAMGCRNAIAGIEDLCGKLPIPRNLAEIGLHEDQVDAAAAEIAAGSYPNPRPVTANSVAALLQAAWQGSSPLGVRQ